MTIVHALEKLGLLARSRGQGDARRIAFMLTDAGADALVAAKDAIAQHEAWLRNRVGEGDVDGLYRLAAPRSRLITTDIAVIISNACIHREKRERLR